MIKINLETLLEGKCMTQKELAELTGIRRSTICDICHNNAIYIKIDNLEKLCSVLECKISDLICLK